MTDSNNLIYKNSKKAFIDKIMLGFFLIAFTTVFVGTISDEMEVRNKILALKKIAQTASLSAAKYYVNENKDTNEAEDIAKGIIKDIPLGAKLLEDEDSIKFEWEPDNSIENMMFPKTSVTVTIDSYTQDLFWFRLIGWNEKKIENISSKVNIPDTSIAINGCDKTFDIGETYDFLYRETNQFHMEHKFAFYNKFAINAQNSFMNDIPQFLNLKYFLGQDINVEVLNCDGSSRKVIPVHIDNGYCAKGCCSINFFGGFSFGGCNFITGMMCTMFDMFEHFTKDMFHDIIWSDATQESCENANMFRITFKVLDKKKVYLEY